jgi:mRNA-degrading endonuclease RelE of RelBE toxin-antitoxin system
MKRKIIQLTQFSKTVDSLLKKRQLLSEDFNIFQKELAENPEMGDVVAGTGGVRKARLKSSSHGKSGGFRVCYYDIVSDNEIFLILIYAKNKQEDLTPAQKKSLKEIVTILRRTFR